MTVELNTSNLTWAEIGDKYLNLYTRAGPDGISEAYNFPREPGIHIWGFAGQENALTREFREISAWAALKMGFAYEVNRLEVWLDAVLAFLIENRPDMLCTLGDGQGAIIRPVLASMIFCSALAKADGITFPTMDDDPLGGRVQYRKEEAEISMEHSARGSSELETPSSPQNTQEETDNDTCRPDEGHTSGSSGRQRRVREKEFHAEGTGRFVNDNEKKYARRGDLALLEGKAQVSFLIAEAYAGKTQRWLRELARTGALEMVGEGRNRKLTVESLLRYFPPESRKQEEVGGSRRK